MGNKLDLADSTESQDMRKVLRSEGLKAAQSFETEYFETSAKENVNVNELMQHIMGLVYESELKKYNAGQSRVTNSIIITRASTVAQQNQHAENGSKDCKC